MIDILLNRQLEFGGVSSTHNGWVEPGNQVVKVLNIIKLKYISLTFFVISSNTLEV